MPKPLFVSHLEFDHTFTQDQRHRFLAQLEKLRFTLLPGATEHPGGVCRFIAFEQKCRHYLEFIHQTKGAGRAGLSFRTAKGNLKGFYQRLQRSSRLDMEYVHRNYDWQKGEDEYRPGWNFLNFPKSTPKNLWVWITEYEKSTQRKKRITLPHKNQALAVVGIEFQVSLRDRKFFECLLGGSLEHGVVLACGTKLYFRDAKRTRQTAVAVAMKDLDRLNQAKHGFTLTSFAGAPALRIKNPAPKMWDILLVNG